MKTIPFFIIMLALLVVSCKLDNYESPNATFYGSIIDIDTNTPIQQELIQGSMIEYTEKGYKNPEIQQLRFKSDGTFRNNLMFSGYYKVAAVRGNFLLIPPVDSMLISGDTEYKFLTRPFIRINDVKMTFDGKKGKVIATFKLERVSGNAVKTVILLADKNPNVSFGIRTVAVQQTVNEAVGSERVFRLEMSTSKLTSKESYYFRVGALIADVGEAKYNYSTAIRLDIDNTNVVAPEPDKGVLFDDCESLAGVDSSFPLSLDASDPQRGNYSIKAEGTGVVFYQRVLKTPFDTKINKENGHLSFSLFISDLSKFNMAANGAIEITSSGSPDQQELAWSFDNSLGLGNGWNDVVLNLKDGIKTGGDANLSAITFMRIYHTGVTGSVVFKIDNIRFY